MRTININAWDRQEHYRFFRGSAFAHFHIGCDLDITNFRAKTKVQKLAFSFAMTHVATQAMNAVEAFRYRIRGEAVVLHEVIHPAFTYVAPDKKYFKLVVADGNMPLPKFVAQARAKALSQTGYFVMDDLKGRDDFIFISSIPKVSFTHLSHTIPANKDDAVPRLSWGKYYERDGRVLLPFNVQAHHSFVDGDHMGEYLETLQSLLDNY